MNSESDDEHERRNERHNERHNEHEHHNGHGRLDLPFDDPIEVQDFNSPYRHHHHEQHHMHGSHMVMLGHPHGHSAMQDHSHPPHSHHMVIHRHGVEQQQQEIQLQEVEDEQERDKLTKEKAQDPPQDREETPEEEIGGHDDAEKEGTGNEDEQDGNENAKDPQDKNENTENDKNLENASPKNLKNEKMCAAADMKTSPIKRFNTRVEIEPMNALVKSQQAFIEKGVPTTPLEVALAAELDRKNSQIEKLKSEVIKLKKFISKRKQTYKRKRKEGGAPTRALSAYNIFVQERFEQLAKRNEQALMNADADTTMKRVPPSSLVAKTGHEWRVLPEAEKNVYKERAKADKKRYNEQMAKYQPPEKQVNKRRNKTGYNVFFTAHVSELKSSDGVPSERGSVARLVGSAWKELNPEQKQYYEEQADSMNQIHSDNEEEEEIKEIDKSQEEYDPNLGHMDPSRMPHAPVVHQPSQHDPRAPYPAPPPPGHYPPPYPYPYEYYPPMPPPPGVQGRHPPFPYPPHPHYPPPPYHEHHHHQQQSDDL